MRYFLAGPTARLIEIMAKGYGVDYDLGIEEINLEPTSVFYNENRISASSLKTNWLPILTKNKRQPMTGGLMSASRDEEQQMMLGHSSDETDRTRNKLMSEANFAAGFASSFAAGTRRRQARAK